MRRALAGGLAAIDAGWIYPWSLLFGAWISGEQIEPLLPWWLVFGLLLVGRLVSRGVRRLAVRGQRAGRIAAVLLGMALALGAGYSRYAPDVDPSGAILLGGLTLWLWWRGLSQGRGSADFETIESAFRRGVGGLLLLVAVAALTSPRLGELEAAAGASVVSFFAIGLASLGLARLLAVREGSRARAGAPPAINRQWLGTMVAVVGAVVLGALLLDALLSFGLLTAVLRPIWSAITFVLFLLVLVVAIPLGLVAQFLVEGLRGRIPPLQLGGGMGALQRALEELRQGQRPVQVSPTIEAIAEWAAIAALVMAVAIGLYRAIDWWREREREEDVDEERELLWNWREVWPAILSFFKGLLRRRPMAPSSNNVERQRPAVAPAMHDVRAIYRALLTRGAEHGAPRRPATTPHEHQPRLAERLEPDADVEAITGAYVAVRYGEQPSPEEADQLRQRLERIHQRA